MTMNILNFSPIPAVTMVCAATNDRFEEYCSKQSNFKLTNLKRDKDLGATVRYLARKSFIFQHY